MSASGTNVHSMYLLRSLIVITMLLKSWNDNEAALWQPDHSEHYQILYCDEPELNSTLNDDTFPSTDQIWGMIGTILATVACWIVYTKVRFGRKRHQEHHILHSKPRLESREPRITANTRRGH